MPLADLTLSGLGGGAWANLKADDSKFPPVEALKQAKLWKNENLYKTTVWGWLTEEDDGSAPALASSLTTDQGEVYSLDVRHGGRDEKLLVGGLGPVLVSRTMAAMVFCDVDAGWPDHLAAAISTCHKQRSGVKLAMWGTPESIDYIIKGPLATLQAPGGQLQGYKSRVLQVFLPHDDPLPGRPTWTTNDHRTVLLVSPQTFRSSPGHMVTQQGWTASLLVHLVHVLDMARLVLIVAWEGIKHVNEEPEKFTPIRSNHVTCSHVFCSLLEPCTSAFFYMRYLGSKGKICGM